MSMTDPIADFLTRIRNGIMAAHETVEIPSSNLKKELARILREQGYIESFETTEGRPGAAGERIVVRLKYTENRTSVISGIRRVSRPGQRTYVDAKHVPKVLGGMGTDRVHLPRRDDRPRRAQGGRRRRGRCRGLVTPCRASDA